MYINGSHEKEIAMDLQFKQLSLRRTKNSFKIKCLFIDINSKQLLNIFVLNTYTA